MRMKWLGAVTMAFALGFSLAASALPTDSPGPLAEDQVDELEGVEVTEHLNETIPLDLSFTDDSGRDVKLSQYFDGRKPVLLTLNYYNCPMLCTLQLNGLVDALKNVNLAPGKDYEMVTISINPRETPNLARLKKDSYVKSFRPESAAGWHFLVGRQPQIDAITGATGFGYKYDEKTKEFAHAAVTMILTPEGKLSRYLYGVFFEPKDPQTLRLSLLEATEGKIGSPLDQVLLFCYHYDPQAGSYSVAAWKVMQISMMLTALVLLAVLVPYWIREYRKSRRQIIENANP